MPVRDAPQLFVKLLGRHQIAALPLNRLDDDRGNLFRRENGPEELFFQELHAFNGAGVRLLAVRAAIAIGKRRMIDGQHRAEPAPLYGFAAGEREGAHRAAMKASKKCHKLVAACVITRQLNGSFYRFGAGITKRDSLAKRTRRQSRQLFSQQHHAVVIEIRAGHVQELSGLSLNRLEHPWVRMARCRYRDARVEIQKAVPVHTFDDRPVTALHHEGITPCIRSRKDIAVPLDDGGRLWSGQGSCHMREARISSPLHSLYSKQVARKSCGSLLFDPFPGFLVIPLQWSDGGGKNILTEF